LTTIALYGVGLPLLIHASPAELVIQPDSESRMNPLLVGSCRARTFWNVSAVAAGIDGSRGVACGPISAASVRPITTG
jgi:hypothetical protein